VTLPSLHNRGNLKLVMLISIMTLSSITSNYIHTMLSNLKAHHPNPENMRQINL